MMLKNCLESWLLTVKGVRLVSEGTDGANVNNVSGEFTEEGGVFQVCANLHVTATTTGAQIGTATNFIHKSNASSALNATGHYGANKWADVLVLNSSLLVQVDAKTRTIRAKGHRLILQIALATLITDGTVKRVIE